MNSFRQIFDAETLSARGRGVKVLPSEQSFRDVKQLDGFV